MAKLTLPCSLLAASLLVSACSGSVEESPSGDGDGDSGDGDLGDGDGDGDGDSPSGDGDERTWEDRLEGRSFELESAEGYTPVDDTTPGIAFSEGGMGFHAGCNQHFSEVTFEGDVLLAEGFGSTLIGCDENLHEQDQWFAEFFASSPTVSIDGDRVTFTAGDVTLVFLDDEVANPAPPLVGTVWEMTAFVDGQIAFGGSFDSPATVTFGNDGVAHVFTGCNTGELTYEHNDTSINFGPGTGYTEAGCPDMADVEQHVQAIFQQGEVTYSFNGQELAIDRGDMGVRAREQ